MNLLVASVTPVFIIIIYVYLKDKYEKESKRILLISFLFGAIVSVIISTLLYVIFDLFIPITDEYSVIQQLVRAFLVVALIEEFSKYIIVRYFSQPREDFNEPYDGIIHAVMVSMGFAAVENIFYVLDGGMSTAIVRAFTAVPAHATFAIMMGYFMGKAKFTNQRVKWNLIGLGLAILFHGTYDFFLFINFIPGISIGAFISLFIGIVLSKRAIKAHQEGSFFNPKNGGGEIDT